jgi:PPOX class probable F420-dependent enzyme
LATELLAAQLMANLATHSRDGGIHLVTMWFLWDGRHLLIPTNHATQKVRNLERDPRATVMIDDSGVGLDLRGITLTCEAEIVRAPQAYGFNRQIHLKYLSSAERDLPDVDAYMGTDDVTIRLMPTSAFSWDLRNTPAGRAVLVSRSSHLGGEG